MPKEHQSKSNEKAQPARPAAESAGTEIQPEGLNLALKPGGLAELPPALRPKYVMRLQQASGNQAVQRAIQTSIIQRQGGGGGNTAPIPALPDPEARRVLAVDVLKKAYGDKIKEKTKVVGVESESALRAEYDRSMIAQGKKFKETDENGEEKLRDWQPGDAAKHPDMKKEFAGFNDPSGTQVYVDLSKPPDEQTATIAHELLHASSSGNFVAVLGKGIDEGMTEKLTIDAFARSGYSVTSGMFAEWVTFANRLVAAFGEGAMMNSYFGGTEALKNAINDLLGKGSFLAFTQAVRNQQWDKVNDMITRGKLAVLESLLSGWVSDDDIAAVEELYRNALDFERQQMRSAIQAAIPDLWSIGQRTRLRLLLAS